jgi:chitodextrinase
VLGLLLFVPARAQAAVCQSSGPAGGAYTVQVCFTAPADGSSATGDQTVTATATVTGTNPGIRRMTFYMNGGYLLTDYQAPYTFVIPTTKFVDGAYTVEAEAWMRDGFISDRASVGINFANGITTPPTNGNQWSPTPGTDPPPGRPLVVGAAGDGAGGEQSETDVTNLIASWNPNLMLYLGDVYENGSIAEFYNWYRPQAQAGSFYGRFRSITDPVVGNHEYNQFRDGTAPGYFDYWDNIPHYYSYDSHGWHFVALDSTGFFHQTGTSSPQYQWLSDQLNSFDQQSAHPCTIVYWHEPLFNIGDEGSQTTMSAIWQLLAQHHVTLVLNGHDHTYQRWARLDGNGNPDPNGIPEIIVGTGGHAMGSFVTSDSRIDAAVPTTFGAFRLELNGAGAAYQFDNTGGQVLDSGSLPCDTTATDTTAPSAPTTLTATAAYKTRIDLAWTTATDDVGVTGYEIYRDGQPLVTIGPASSYSDMSVLPGSTHTYKVRALDAATNVSGFSNEATATTPAVAVLFHDGFETGDLSKWTSNSGLVAQQAHVFAGSWAAEATATGGAGASAFKNLAQGETSLYYVTRFNVLSQTTNVNLLRFRNNTVGANAMATLFVSSTGKLGLRNDVTGVATTSTTTVSRNAWHTAQVHLTINGTSSSTEVWLDGNAVADLTLAGINLGTNPIGRLELGDPTTARTFDVALDEVAYDRDFIGDLTPPTPASNLTATAHSGLEVDLAWTPGTDDVGIAGYDVYRNGTLIASIPAATSYADKTVSPFTSYTYKLVSKDAAGNVSGFSNSASATTGDIFTDDFESGTLLKWTTVAGLMAQMTNVDGGQWAAEAASNGTAGASAQTQLDSTVNELYYRARFRVLSQGTNVSLLRVRTAANGALASAFVSSTGKIGYRNDTTSTATTSSLGVAFGVWHEVQLHVLVNGSSSQVGLWLDGVSAVSQTDSLGTSPIGRLELGDPAAGRTFDVAFDNVVADPTFVTDTAAPSAPANLHTTSVGAHTVSLAWDPANDDVGVTGYRVYRGGAEIGQVDGGTLAFDDTGLNDATQYTYTVTAIDAVGHESGPSNAIHPTTLDATPPSQPTGLVASPVAGQNRVDLTWTASSDNVGVTGYRIYRDGSTTPLDSVGGSTTTYSDTSVSPGTQYTYRVTAVDAAGNESAASDPATTSSADTIPPQPPTSVTATAISETRIDLSWSGASDNVGVTGYQIFRNGSSTPIAAVGASPTTYSDTGLTAATTYSYTIKAVDASGNTSDPSSAASATTLDTTAPTPPTSVTATAISETRIDLSWSGANDNVGVTGYRIFRNGGTNPIATVGASPTTYSDTGLSAGTTYSYTIKAVDAAGNVSTASSAASATTLDLTPPLPPTTATATAVGDSQINLTWSGASDNAGITAYRIYRNGGSTPIATVGPTPTSYSDTGLTPVTTYTYTVRAVDAAGNVSDPSPVATATTMVFSDGFESGNLSKWTSVSGLAVQNTNVFAGSWAAEAQSKNASDFASKTLPSTYTSLYYRMRVKILQGKPATVDVLRLRTAAGGDLMSILYDSNRRLGYRNDVTGTTLTSTTALAVGTWYEVKVHLIVNGASSQTEVWLNGTKITALSRTDSFGTTPIGRIVAGETTSGRQYDFAIDDVVADTAP